MNPSEQGGSSAPRLARLSVWLPISVMMIGGYARPANHVAELLHKLRTQHGPAHGKAQPQPAESRRLAVVTHRPRR